MPLEDFLPIVKEALEKKPSPPPVKPTVTTAPSKPPISGKPGGLGLPCLKLPLSAPSGKPGGLALPSLKLPSNDEPKPKEQASEEPENQLKLLRGLQHNLEAYKQALDDKLLKPEKRLSTLRSALTALTSICSREGADKVLTGSLKLLPKEVLNRTTS